MGSCEDPLRGRVEGWQTRFPHWNLRLLCHPEHQRMNTRGYSDEGLGHVDALPHVYETTG